jgi:competence ComEA-like helix-hairpin-helix protein
MDKKYVLFIISIIVISVKLVDIALYSDSKVQSSSFKTNGRNVEAKNEKSKDVKDGAEKGPGREAAASKALTLESVNEMDSKGLEKLDGVGPKTASAIIEYRKRHGRFKHVDELINVKGIGPKKLELIKKQIQ